MKKSERLIRIARDKISGDILDAKIIFEESRKVDSEIRKLLNEKKIYSTLISLDHN